MAYLERQFESLQREEVTTLVKHYCNALFQFCWQQECLFQDSKQERSRFPTEYASSLTEDDWQRQTEPLNLLTITPLDKPRYIKTPEGITLKLSYQPVLQSKLVVEAQHLTSYQPHPEDYLAAAALKARFPWLNCHLPPVAADQKNPSLVSFAAKRYYFRRILLSRRPSAGLRMLDTFNLLEVYLPELTAGRNITQNRFHAYDIFEHLLRSCDSVLAANEEVRWAALLHDIGKVGTRRENPNGEASFHNHEVLSAKQTVIIMKRLGMPRELGEKIKFLVRNHMFHYTEEWSDRAVRRFMRKISQEDLKNLIALRLADRKGSGKKTAFPRALQKLIEHIEAIEREEKRFKVKDLAINGYDLMRLGMKPGPEMGKLLRQFTQAVVAGELNNDPQVLLARAKEYLSNRTHEVSH